MPSQCRFGVNAFWLCCRMAIGWLPMRSFIGPTSRAKRFSKWNPIEYRLFSHISLNWAGQPLRYLDVMLGFIRGTTTTAGLKVEAYLDATWRCAAAIRLPKLHSLMPMRNSSITCSKPTSMQTTKADLPIERPTKLYLKTNTCVTKSWGIELPRAVFARADEVIE